MEIGTPLSESAKRIMFLGSGELGKEVIIALQRYGAEVIAVDRYENAPGQQVAHRSHTIDMTDGTQLRDLILLEKPHIIVPEIEAIATDILSNIENEGISEVIPSARAVQLTMNREGIRRLAAEELKLPTSKYAFADSPLSLENSVNDITGYPCIVKPVMSSSGKGQSYVRNSDELKKAWDYAMKSGRVSRGRVIVEEVINFDFEITLLTVRSLTQTGSIQTSFCEPIGHIQEDGDYVESWQPQAMPVHALREAKQIAQTITDGLGGRGIFGVELFVKGDSVYFSEVSPRPHDTGMVTMVTQYQSEFELHARAILGLPISTDLRDPGASAVIYGRMDKKGISFKNLDKALSLPKTEVRLFGKPEAYVKRRMGVALAFGESVKNSRERAIEAASSIIPFDPEHE